MLPILSPSEAAALDRSSAEGGVSVLELMENAGRAVAKAATALAGGAYGRRAAVLCGKGSNGGDGLVAARLLEHSGMGVCALLLAGPNAFEGPAAQNFQRYDRAGSQWRTVADAQGGLGREVARADVVIDAVFGTGFMGRAQGPFADAIVAMNGSAAPVLAVDVPSGVEAENGAVLGPAVDADVTVTFGALKPGLVFLPGAAHAGEVVVADIGFPPALVRSDLLLVEQADAMPPADDPHANKRSRGTVLVVAGSRGMTGAASLCASAAYRTGAGLVVLAVPESILRVAQAAVTEALFVPLPETADGTVAASAEAVLLERAREAHAMAIGPGLSRQPETAGLVRRVVAAAGIPIVLDADGLNAFQGHRAELADREAPAAITPHAGEFARLFGVTAQEVEEDRVGMARKAAEELRCTVLLKGPSTLVADPGGVVYVNPTGGPALATGGTGDVLTGMVAALMSRRRGGPTIAAYSAAFAHGRAGDLAASERGEGTVAADLLGFIPRALFGVAAPGPAAAAIEEWPRA